MRLQGVAGGNLFATDGQDLFVGPDPESLTLRSRLPTPTDAGLPGRALRDVRPVNRLLRWVVGDFQTTTAHPVTPQTVLATAGRDLFVSNDGGRNWSGRHRVHGSSPPFGVLPSAVCKHDGTLFVGEYPLAHDVTPRIFRSPDLGRSWSVIELPDVRHVHAVQSDPFDGDVWVTTGDADAECSIGRLRGDGVEPIGGGSQRWRAVEPAFTPSAVLWGMDCAYERNRIFRLDRDQLGNNEPEPQVVHTVDNSVFYSAVVPGDGTTTVAFSTVGGGGTDSSAPERSVSTGECADVVVSGSGSEFTDWTELATFRRRRSVTTRLALDRLPTANAYVFLAALGGRLIVNPFNTVDHNCELLSIDTTDT